MENYLYFKINRLNKVNVDFILLYKGKYKGKIVSDETCFA